MNLLKQAKRTVLGVAKGTGAFAVSARSSRRNSRLLVLGYHGVSLADEHEWHPALYLSPKTFRGRMESLKRCRCTVLSLDDALDRLYRGDLPERAVVLTFDDGAYDFRQVVWPILKEYGYPATLYWTTYWVTVGRPVVPVIWNYMLWKKRGSVFPAPKLLGSGAQLDLTTGASRGNAMQQLTSRSEQQKLDGVQEDAVTQELAQILGIDYEDLRRRRILSLLQPEEARELAADGVSVQLHMHEHNTPTVKDGFEKNLLDNRNFIEGLVGYRPAHFCYPGGIYQKEFLPWLRDLGIKSATTCDPALTTSSVDPLLVPRLVDTSCLSTLEFESWLVGLGELLPRR